MRLDADCLRGDGWLARPRERGLAMPAGKEVEEDKQHYADEDGRSEGEKDRHVFAAIGEVAGKAAKRNAKARGQQQAGSDEDEQAAEAEKQFA